MSNLQKPTKGYIF